MKKTSKKVLAVLMLIAIFISVFQNIIYATQVTSAYIENLGDCRLPLAVLGY